MAPGGWTCKCGKVAYAFPTRTPIMCLLDCCRDCYTFGRYAAAAAGEGPPTVPFRNYYMPNDLTVVRGREHLRAYKLTEDSPSIRLLAECCKSRAGAVHPAYDGLWILLPADAGKLDLDHVEPDGLYWLHSLKGVIPDDELPVWDGPEHLCIRGDEAPEEFMRKCGPFMEKLRSRSQGPRVAGTLQSVISSLEDATVLNLRVGSQEA